ncbi:MAG: hypothetical protein H8D67_31010 [Deltaproteobacteria bacterium]|nr:hypothetical protein [Deltaproteobacteria bacterium]
MTIPYPKHKILPKLRAERNRLERAAISDISEPIARYVEAAYKKIEKAIELLEKEAKSETKLHSSPIDNP